METINMPSKFKNLVRARMAKTGEAYQTAARRIRANVKVVKAGGEVPSPSVPDGGFLSPLAELGAERNEVSADSPSATQSPKGAAARIKNLAGIRNAARQFHIDYVGKYDIAVDAVTLACSAVPKPWFTLRECGGKANGETLPFEVPAGFRRTSGKRIRVFIVDAGVCIGTTSIAGGRLTSDEVFRFTLAAAARRVPPGCRPERDENLQDWVWGQKHRGNGITFSRHSVYDADLAHEREADVRAAVAAGKYPVLLTVGTKRAARFAVIEKPMLPNDDG